MFFAIVFTVWATVLAHLGWRSGSWLGLRGWTRPIPAAAVGLAGFAYVPARMLVSARPEDGLAASLLYSTALGVGLVSILWSLLLVMEAVAAVAWLLTRKRLRDAAPRTRRWMAAALWSAGVGLGVAGWAGGQATSNVTQLLVTVPGAVERRFVVIADAHLGRISSEDQWRRTLQRVRDLEPDAVLIPGDLVDDRTTRAAEQVALLRDVLGPLPVYVTTGNHEYYAGPQSFFELCHDLGLQLLRQQVVPLAPGLSLAGLDDAHFLSPTRAAAALRPQLKGAVLLLTHRPAAARLFADRPATLALAGHTHGGQIPPMVFAVGLGNTGFLSGQYRVGAADLYVSRGTGTWGPPMRLLAPPELVLLHVTPGPEFAVRRASGRPRP